MRVPLPDRWWVLFDAEYEDMWSCCGTVMRLWDGWAMAEPWWSAEVSNEPSGGPSRPVDVTQQQRARWTRAWKLAISKKYVRRWVEKEREEVE
jgi:hypothetical protein